jgi:hypothetical protein
LYGVRSLHDKYSVVEEKPRSVLAVKGMPPERILPPRTEYGISESDARMDCKLYSVPIQQAPSYPFGLLGYGDGNAFNLIPEDSEAIGTYLIHRVLPTPVSVQLKVFERRKIQSHPCIFPILFLAL